MPAEPPVYEAAVIGGGPAGLSAAVWLGRYRRHAVVLDSGSYRNAAVDLAHGFLGHDPVAPADLRARAQEELSRYPSVERCEATVVRASGVRDRFELETETGDRLQARRVLVATGVRDAVPDVAGFDRHYGADVFHCAGCDGFEAQGRDVVVFGWGEHIAGFSLALLTWARSITVVTDGHVFEGSPQERELLDEYGVAIVEDEAIELVGERGALERVLLASGGSLPCQMAFFSIAHQPNSDLAVALGASTTEGGCVDADRDGVTSVPGLYAVGDLTPGVQLIANAVAKGAAAGVHCSYSLLGERP